MTEPGPPRTPYWVKALGIALVALLIVFIAVHLIVGGHGPGEHMLGH